MWRSPHETDEYIAKATDRASPRAAKACERPRDLSLLTVESMLAPSNQSISTREIVESDLGEVVELLAKGFWRRPPAYWWRGLDIMRRHPHPPELPRYGYLLEYNGRPVRVILLISTIIRSGGSSTTRCNVWSWYIDP